MANNGCSVIEHYRVHIFIFFFIIFVGLTFTHPAILLNDEFITTSQLRQLHEGHQIIINEGKYGFFENGTMTSYFAQKSNLLAYSLYVPLISLPAYWIIDLTGAHFVSLNLILWTISALIIIFFIRHFFPAYDSVGTWKWTPLAYGLIFLLFFINLFFYSSFPVDSVDNFPEILAIVITNIILLSISGVLIYEINQTIFDDPGFSFFGMIVCLFSSSYVLWASFCKDHVPVLPIFIAIFLCLVRFLKTSSSWYLPLAFLLCGTLAWGRPELAFGMFGVVLIVYGFSFYEIRISKASPRSKILFLLCSPLFTILGALPFFLNNFLLTKNVFLPTHSLYLREAADTVVVNMSMNFSTPVGIKSPLAVITRYIPSIPVSPTVTISDIIGIAFYPQNGSIGIFAVVPFALVMICIGVYFMTVKKINLSSEERKMIALSGLMIGGVFFSYVSLIHLLNTDPGIAPDIRYLMPLYLPLTIVGLIILRNLHLLSGSISEIKELFIITFLGLGVSLLVLPMLYLQNLRDVRGFPPMEEFFSIFSLSLVILAIVSIAVFRKSTNPAPALRYIILLTCVIPFLWQINETFMLSAYSIYAKYTFWIPVISTTWRWILLTTLAII
jgi:hypothetical protein